MWCVKFGHHLFSCRSLLLDTSIPNDCMRIFHSYADCSCNYAIIQTQLWLRYMFFELYRMYVCMYVCIYVCMYVYMYGCIIIKTFNLLREKGLGCPFWFHAFTVLSFTNFYTRPQKIIDKIDQAAKPMLFFLSLCFMAWSSIL